MSDMVFQRVSPPDNKMNLTIDDLAHVLVKRLGLKRKESRAQHAKLLLELLRYKKENIPLNIEQMSAILAVSQSQTYEELRKWRSIGLVEFVKIPAGNGFVKGYMISSNTVNRLMDRVEGSMKAFMRKTRRIAKDFDDLLMLGMARKGKDGQESEKDSSENIEKKKDDQKDETESNN